VQGVLTDITDRVRAGEQAEQAAAAAERERLARDLHDAVTQTLFSASAIASVLPEVWERHPDEARRGLQELRRLTRGALAEMRTLLLELRPTSLLRKSLGELLRQLADALLSRTQTSIALTVRGERELPDEVQVALYRIAQEALNNVVKHAQASHAAVDLFTESHRVTLHVRDDGRGFDPNDVKTGRMGLGIMRERADGIGARVTLQSQPGEGTQVTVTWHDDTEEPES
jgi:signal transduction histidine kinase